MTPQSVSPADKDNPGPEQSYYRAHRKNAEFSPDEAWSLAIDGDSDEQRGYSALRSLDELHAYISSRKYPDLTDSVARGERIVIRFTGDEVGQGADGEPLVVPYTSDHEIYSAAQVSLPTARRNLPLGKTISGATVWTAPGNETGQQSGLRHLTWRGPGDAVHLNAGLIAQDGMEYPGRTGGNTISGPCQNETEAQHAVDTYTAPPLGELLRAAANISAATPAEIQPAAETAYRHSRIHHHGEAWDQWAARKVVQEKIAAIAAERDPDVMAAVRAHREAAEHARNLHVAAGGYLTPQAARIANQAWTPRKVRPPAGQTRLPNLQIVTSTVLAPMLSSGITRRYSRRGGKLIPIS